MSPSPHRYRSLADALAADLHAGLYPSGTRLPSVRHLCRLHRLSLATVTHALHELEDRGLIEARPRRGFFACLGRQPPQPAQTPSPSLDLTGQRKRLMELASTQPPLHSLGHLALPAALLPLHALKRQLAAQLRDKLDVLSVGTVIGSEALRVQLATRAARMGCRFRMEDIVVTQGEGESLELCLRVLAQPGDLIAVSSPAPFRALEVIASLGLRVLEIPAPVETGLSVPALAFALRHHKIAACLVEPSFDRATGSAMQDSEKQALATLVDQHGLPLIECDLMGELYGGAHRPRPVKAFDLHDRVLYCGSFACIAGLGFALGYIASGRHRLQLRAARMVHGDLIAGLTDHALAGFMASHSFEPHLRRLRLRLSEQVRAHRQAILDSFPPGTKVSQATGGYVLWLELPAKLDAAALLERVRRSGYNFVPGAVFTLGAAFDHCLRLAAPHPLDAQRAEGIRVIGEAACRMLADSSESNNESNSEGA